MAKTSHVATFSSTAHTKTVDEMRARRESVHAKGEDVYRRTGHMDPLVSVQGKVRKSKFAWERTPEGTFILAKGPKRPYLFGTDGTGSFGAYVARAFEAASPIYAMLEQNAVATRHQMDFSFAVAQDRGDRHDMIQVPEFESDNRFAEHMRLLVPDKNGGDAPEDYDYLIWYAAKRVQSDLWRYGAGHRGIFVLLLDAPGRGYVDPTLVERHLGVTIQGRVETRDSWRELQTKFHAYIVVFGDAVDWWRRQVGRNSVVVAPSDELFAEVQAGLVYVTDTAKPTAEGLYEFLNAGGQGSKISRRDSDRIWRAYQDAGLEMGAGANWMDGLPQAGDEFQHMTDLWPIGHERASENPAPGLDSGEDDDAGDDSGPSSPRRSPIDWKRF